MSCLIKPAGCNRCQEAPPWSARSYAGKMHAYEFTCTATVAAACIRPVLCGTMEANANANGNASVNADA